MRNNMSAAAMALAIGSVSAQSLYDNYKYGNMFYSGPTSDSSIHITKATYSMKPPATPCNYKEGGQEELTLWIGLQPNPANTDVLKLDFVQPLLDFSPNLKAMGCEGVAEDQWCVAASTYHPDDGTGQPWQQGQTYVPVPKGKTLDFEVKIGEDDMVVQTVSVDGKVISTQSDTKGMKPQVFYSGNECYLPPCGTLNGYSWDNIVIELNKADEAYGNTLTLTGATSDGGLQTSDGGKTWTAESIKIGKDYFYSDGSKTECS